MNDKQDLAVVKAPLLEALERSSEAQLDSIQERINLILSFNPGGEVQEEHVSTFKDLIRQRTALWDAQAHFTNAINGVE